MTGVQGGGHAPDRAALARRIVAFKHRHQRVTAHAFIAHQPGQTRLLGNQLLLVIVFVQTMGHVQTIEQALAVYRVRQRRHRDGVRLDFGGIDCCLQAFEQDFAHRQAAVIRVHAFNDVPRGEVAAGATNHPLTEMHHLVVGFGLLPVQRADAPAVQRIVLQGFEPGFHLFFRQVKPELQYHRAFIAEQFFQPFSAIDCLIEHRVLELTMHAPLQHLAVPVAEKHPHSPLGRQLTPIAPGRRVRQFFIGLGVEGAHFDQSRVHPLAQQLDGFALASPFDAVDQHNHRRTFLLMQLVLRFEQGLTQRGHFVVVSFFVDDMANFSGFEHGKLPGKMPTRLAE